MGGLLDRADLDEVETGVLRHAQRLGRRDDAVVLAVLVDQLDLGHLDVAVGAGTLVDLGCGSVGTTQGRLSWIVAGAGLAARGTACSMDGERLRQGRNMERPVGERDERLTVDEREIAAKVADGAEPTLMWCGGFRSDMTGSKAERMVAFAGERGLASVRFDYSGHGASGGLFPDGTISRWVEEAMAVHDRFVSGPVVILGSSMGAWIALRMVQELARRGERVHALVLIAPAPDFTSALMEPDFTEAQREALATDGFIAEPSLYSDEPTIYTRALIEDGRRNAVLDKRLVVGAPVRILQGVQDPDVPWRHAERLVEVLPEDDVVLTLVPDGDHRLSREQDLALLERTLAGVI